MVNTGEEHAPKFCLSYLQIIHSYFIQNTVKLVSCQTDVLYIKDVFHKFIYVVPFSCKLT